MDNQTTILSEKQISAIQSIKKCIWLYFWLLIFEGALRKWVVPMLANPILLIRDPVVLWTYILAFRAGLFPGNMFLRTAIILAWIMFLVGLVAIPGSLLVPIYGIRTDFLHLPMLFVMQNVLDRNDVRKFGYWTLLIAIPMTLLMAVQFRSPVNAWINSGSDEAFGQMKAGEHTRAPGTFSFITGPVLFYGTAAAFLLESLFQNRVYLRWLIISASFAVVMAPFVSGSRALVGDVGLAVVCAIIAGTILQPGLLFRTIQWVVLVAIVTLVLMQLPLFHEGAETLTSRFTEGGGIQEGFFLRALGDIDITAAIGENTPFLGYGLGLGTNVGQMINSGTMSGIALGEGEWSRVCAESGPILGLSYILLRIALMLIVLSGALRSTRQGNVLPFLLFGACAADILNGQWGQATTLGFAIFGAGLSLAARDEGRQNAGAASGKR